MMLQLAVELHSQLYKPTINFLLQEDPGALTENCLISAEYIKVKSMCIPLTRGSWSINIK